MNGGGDGVFVFVLSINQSISAVVHEGCALGSDGESVDASPCTSDDVATSTTVADRYVVNVKMRPKPTRRWSEVKAHVVIDLLLLIAAHSISHQPLDY